MRPRSTIINAEPLGKIGVVGGHEMKKIEKVISTLIEQNRAKSLRETEIKYYVAELEERIRKNRLGIASRMKSTQHCLDQLAWFKDYYAHHLK